LPDWPVVPLEDKAGRLIAQALGKKRSAILANHVYIRACSSIEECTYQAISIAHVADLALRAMSAREIRPMRDELASAASDFRYSRLLSTRHSATGPLSVPDENASRMADLLASRHRTHLYDASSNRVN
jgi:hypothetical protein